MLQVKTIRGLSTGWESRGTSNKDAPILLLLHGFPDSARTWSPQLEYFDGKALVVAPYVRGVGPSSASRDKRRFDPDSIVLDTLQILREVDPSGCREIVIVGHDFGGPYAVEVARLLGKRARGLLLINGPPLDLMFRRLLWPRQLKKSWYIFWFQVPRLPERSLEKNRLKMAKAFRRSGYRDTLEPPPGVSVGVQQYRRALRTFFKQLRRKITPLETPVIVLSGKRDPFVLPIQEHEMNRIAKHFEIHEIDGGHWLQHSHGAEVNSAIEKLLAGSSSEREKA